MGNQSSLEHLRQLPLSHSLFRNMYRAHHPSRFLLLCATDSGSYQRWTAFNSRLASSPQASSVVQFKQEDVRALTSCSEEESVQLILSTPARFQTLGQVVQARREKKAYWREEELMKIALQLAETAAAVESAFPGAVIDFHPNSILISESTTDSNLRLALLVKEAIPRNKVFMAPQLRYRCPEEDEGRKVNARSQSFRLGMCLLHLSTLLDCSQICEANCRPDQLIELLVFSASAVYEQRLCWMLEGLLRMHPLARLTLREVQQHCR